MNRLQDLLPKNLATNTSLRCKLKELVLPLFIQINKTLNMGSKLILIKSTKIKILYQFFDMDLNE